MGGGVTISASPATINIPTGSIEIANVTYTDQSYISGVKTFTVPNNIRVIRIYFYATSARVYPDNGFSFSLKSGNRWLFSDIGDDDPLDTFRDVGVTPGKTYALTGYLNGKIDSCGINGLISLKYSPSINDALLDNTDY